GQAERAAMVRDALELFDTGEARGGEAAGQGLLVRGEHIDREPAARPERGVALRLVGDADQDERRVERDRAHRAGGETGRPLLIVPGGDDGDAGGEVAERASELVGTKHLI